MVIYYGSDGDRIENPSEEELKDIFFKKDASYWQQGSGDSSLEVEGCDECLLFFMMNHMDFL